MTEEVYTLYHIPGRKVGCTIDFERRKKQYDEGTVFEIIDTLPISDGDKLAGDLEWFYAELYGYKKGPHYTEKRWDVVLSPEELSENGRFAAKASDLGKVTDP